MTVAAPGFRVGGRYELTSTIAAGGMAQVWRAEDTVLGRPVAVKILHPHLATDHGFLLRFRREAVAAARLSHPGIVAIYDTVSADGIEAIIMELIDGQTLRAVLDDTPQLSASDATIVGTQVADALADAHRGGVVHRDIKPSNILLCRDRRVMVTDFGIAKAGEDTDLTVTGALLGTAKYLSPEQVRGDDVDPRSDLYSLGVVLYEALAGQPPFKAETDAATALARLHNEPAPLMSHRPDVPAELSTVVMRLLESEPERRYARATDVRAALSAASDPAATDPTLVAGSSPGDSPPPSTDHAAATSSSAPATGAAQLPATAPQPFEHDPADHERPDSFVHSERSWLVPALVVVLLAGALLVAAVLISRGVSDATGSSGTDDGPGSSSGTSEGQTETTPLSNIRQFVEPEIRGATSFDPFGDDRTENENLVLAAFDGDDQTSWRTTTYHSPNFGRLKSGVGLLLDMEGSAEVSEVEFETPTIAWTVEIYVGDDFSGGPETWGEPAARASYAGDETVDLDFAPATGRYVLFWVTDPGISDDRDDDPRPDYRFELVEISVD